LVPAILPLSIAAATAGFPRVSLAMARVVLGLYLASIAAFVALPLMRNASTKRLC
jgi:hypothetical protein